MYCLNNLNHSSLPNDIIVLLSQIYRNIGNSDYYINSLGSDFNKVVDLTVQKDAYYLSMILKLDITEARKNLIIYKNSTPRTKEEKTLFNLKDVLTIYQQNLENLTLKSNDIFNTINYIYSHYNGIKFDTSEATNFYLQNQNNKSKRLILDEMFDKVNYYIEKNSYEKISLFLNYYIDFYNLRPFLMKNDVMGLLLLYALILYSNVNCFKYISFFEIIYKDYDNFIREVLQASVNWKEGLCNTTSFIRYFLNLILKAYGETDMIIRNYKFDKEYNKIDNIENTILNMAHAFTKKEIRQENPYVSESTINRALIELRDKGLIEPINKGRSAKWIKK